MHDTEDYVSHRLERARETLSEAESLFTLGRLCGTVNRIYYSCFYAASALLLTQEMYSSKHRGVISLFNQHWIKTGLLPTSLSDFYKMIFEKRQEGDYEDFVTFDRETVAEWLQQGATFVDAISDAVRKQQEP